METKFNNKRKKTVSSVLLQTFAFDLSYLDRKLGVDSTFLFSIHTNKKRFFFVKRTRRYQIDLQINLSQVEEKQIRFFYYTKNMFDRLRPSVSTRTTSKEKKKPIFNKRFDNFSSRYSSNHFSIDDKKLLE